MTSTNLGQQLAEARRDSERELLVLKAAHLMAEAEIEEDAAHEAGQASHSRRTDEVRGLAIAAEVLGLVITADSFIEMAQVRLVEFVEKAESGARS